ncbi:MAG: hypothetical protein KKB37_10890, partial [Alphaproteobacteria bacterium]|nr:hypothetical protein [Alphaproteobacteria bacterium]
GCDWIVANDVSAATGIMGGGHNEVHVIKANDNVTHWPRMGKDEVAERLVREAAEAALVVKT